MKGATLFLILVGGALALVEGAATRACGDGSCELVREFEGPALVVRGVEGESEVVAF